MALTLLVPGSVREVWQESATLNGGNSRTIPTGVRVEAASLPRILATLYVTPVAGVPQITATVAVVNGRAIVSVNNLAPAGNTAIYILDIMRVWSPQQAPGGVVGVVHVSGGVGAISGMVLPSTDVNVAIYPVVASDVLLNVRRTATGICEILLPAIAAVPPGRPIIIKDSGYNAAANPITVTPAGADKINNAAAAYTIDLSGTALWLSANAVAGDWGIV